MNFRFQAAVYYYSILFFPLVTSVLEGCLKSMKINDILDI